MRLLGGGRGRAGRAGGGGGGGLSRGQGLQGGGGEVALGRSLMQGAEEGGGVQPGGLKGVSMQQHGAHTFTRPAGHAHAHVRAGAALMARNSITAARSTPTFVCHTWSPQASKQARCPPHTHTGVTCALKPCRTMRIGFTGLVCLYYQQLPRLTLLTGDVRPGRASCSEANWPPPPAQPPPLPRSSSARIDGSDARCGLLPGSP